MYINSLPLITFVLYLSSELVVQKWRSGRYFQFQVTDTCIFLYTCHICNILESRIFFAKQISNLTKMHLEDNQLTVIQK